MNRQKPPPLTVSISNAAQCLDVDVSTIKRLIVAGEITSFKLTDSKQGKRLVHYDSLVAFIKRREQGPSGA